MPRLIKIIFLVLFVQLFNCCTSSTIFVDKETELNEDSRIEWVTTKSDTIIDFRKGIDGYAKVNKNIITFRTSGDSVRKYNLTEFKTIYVTSGPNTTSFIVAGVVATLCVVGYYISLIDVGG
jgi:hypothetical protein